MSSQPPPIARYRRQITMVWWLGGGLLILVMLYLTTRPMLFQSAQEPLGWLLPHIVPTMTLTGAVAYFGGSPKATGGDAADVAFLFRLAAGVSGAYLLLIAFVILVASSGTGSSGTLLERLAAWNVILGVLQGLPASFIGVFFAKN